jgi:uncharacterized OB-fold protein
MSVAKSPPGWPLPRVTDVDRQFWDGVQQERLLIQKCQECGRFQFFPRPLCGACLSLRLAWQEASGRGSVYSFTLVRVPRHPVFRKLVEETGQPIVFAEIELAEGVRMLSQIVGCRPEDVRLGARVRVTFEPVPEADFKLPKFRLV